MYYNAMRINSLCVPQVHSVLASPEKVRVRYHGTAFSLVCILYDELEPELTGHGASDSDFDTEQFATLLAQKL